MISPFFLVAFLVISACARNIEFQTYSDPSKDFVLQVPKGWLQEAINRRPTSVASFVGEVTDQDEGIPLGAVLYVTKFYRYRADHPGSNAGYEAYLKDVLLPLDVLFGASPEKLPAEIRKKLASPVNETQLSGLPAKTYRRDFEHYNPFHMSRSYQMRLEDVVIRTPTAYYVLEYPSAAFFSWQLGGQKL